MRSTRFHPRAAFTLIEILVVVVILGIASVVVIPGLGTHNDLNAASAARTMVADMIFAQNRAILGISMRYVNFDIANQKYAILISKPNISPAVYEQNPSTFQNYIALFGASAPPGATQTVALQTPSADGKACIGFDELGQPYSVDPASGVATPLVNTATFPVKCGTFTLTVKVEPYTGAMSVQ
jgi:prepilin-type N-terminal cleavage/methylation domain-containing protein